MSTTTTYGGVTTPSNSDSNDPGAYLLAMAQSFDPRLVQQFSTKAARNSATSALIAAGKRIVCWVDGVGLCAHNGSAWTNQSPPKPYRIDRSYGSGAVATPGSTYTDTTKLSIPGLVNGQLIDVRIQASVRIDGSNRQSILIGATSTGAQQATQALSPVIASMAWSGSNNEYVTYFREMTYFADNGTTTLAITVDCGAGAERLVMNQAQMIATVWPLDAT